jgi:uncharacterized membrane protein YvbJ
LILIRLEIHATRPEAALAKKLLRQNVENECLRCINLITCPKCGSSNKDDSRFCASCGSALYVERAKKRDDCFGPNEPEKACFGLPYGGVIIGIVIGLFIVILGLAQLAGQNISAYIGPFILILIGVLIVVGAIYGLSKRRY